MKRLLVLAVLAAGCLQLPGGEPARIEPSHVESATRGDDAYWMVWVYGTEREECDGPLCANAFCSILFDHEVRPAERAFRHANASAPTRPWAVVAFDHFTDGDCPIAYAHAFNGTRLTGSMGAWGDLTAEVLENGDVLANGREVPLGQRATYSYERRGLAGEFRVENLGAWGHVGLGRFPSG